MTFGGYASLVGFPATKARDEVDWMEYDGVEVDLESLPIDARDVTIPFAFVGNNADVGGFVSFLQGAHSLTVKLDELGGKVFHLRYRSAGALHYAGGIDTITITFREDLPWDGIGGAYASSTIPADHTSTLDGVPFSAYNVRLLQGSVPSFLTPKQAKEYLVLASAYGDGETYDEPPFDTYSGGVWSQSHAGVYGSFRGRGEDITLNCLLVTGTYADFWAHYAGLFRDLVKEDDTKTDRTQRCRRTLVIGGVSEGVYYRSASVMGFFPIEGKIWCQFSLTLGRAN